MEHDCVVLFLGPVLEVGTGTPWPLDCVEVGGRQLMNTGAGDVTGFYDWLRDAQGTLVGVRYWPFEGTLHILERVSNREYVRATTLKCVQIFLSGFVEVDESKSKDQAFQYSAMFLSGDGDCALVVGAEDLDERDLARLANLSNAHRASACDGRRTPH